MLVSTIVSGSNLGARRDFANDIPLLVDAHERYPKIKHLKHPKPMRLAESIGSLFLNFSLVTWTTAPQFIAFSTPTSHLIPEPGLHSAALKYHLAQTPPLPTPLPGVEVEPVNGTVNIKLLNTTGATITYQVLGDTKPRALLGNANFTLQNLKLPVTVTFHREDHGLLMVNPKSLTTGFLEVTFSAATDFSVDRQSLTVSRGGKIYLN